VLETDNKRDELVSHLIRHREVWHLLVRCLEENLEGHSADPRRIGDLLKGGRPALVETHRSGVNPVTLRAPFLSDLPASLRTFFGCCDRMTSRRDTANDCEREQQY
jgi:hypothetical protein